MQQCVTAICIFLRRRFTYTNPFLPRRGEPIASTRFACLRRHIAVCVFALARPIQVQRTFERRVYAISKRYFVVSLVVVSMFFTHGVASALAAPADFRTNFDMPSFTGPGEFYSGSGYCTFGSAICAASLFGNGDPTPFAERVESINGIDYFHVIVGDPASGFAEESYTRYGAGFGSAVIQGSYSPDGGGMETAFISGWPGSPNTGAGNQWVVDSGNIGNPLASVHVSGNGSQDPTKSVFRMIMTSAKGDMSLDVSKPFLDKKPIISQTVQSGNMTSVFVADMRGLSYSEMNNSAPVINTLVIQDPTIPGNGAANFNMADAPQSTVTAGRFTFTPGAGWNTAAGVGWAADNSSFDLGTYVYAGGGGFDAYSFDWTTVFDYSQNALNCTRPSVGNNVGESTRIQEAGGEGCPGHP